MVVNPYLMMLLGCFASFLSQIHFTLWNFAVRQITFTQFTRFNSALHQFDFSDYPCATGYFLGSCI
jgi:hypothetical protein